MIVFNLFGGPGCGKSTLAAGVFYQLKIRGINCELVTEYAKSLVWRKGSLDDSYAILDEQCRRQECLDGKVDFAITDSPLLVAIPYARRNGFEHFAYEAFKRHRKFNNVNFFVNRRRNTYSAVGRNQTAEEAAQIDKEVWQLLIEADIMFDQVMADDGGVNFIVNKIMSGEISCRTSPPKSGKS